MSFCSDYIENKSPLHLKLMQNSQWEIFVRIRKEREVERQSMHEVLYAN